MKKYGIKKIKKKISSFFRKAKSFFATLKIILSKEIREEDFERKMKEIEEFLFSREEGKILLLGIFLVFFIMWIGNVSFFYIAHSEDEDIANAQSKEKIGFSLPTENQEQKIDAKLVNEYKLKSSEKQCEEDKSQKQTSNLCGKDDEEELKRIEQLEKMKKINSIKPRARGPMPYVFDKDSMGRRVCNKKNDHPSKSKNNKKGHMDMECCLDPDETPNPNCYYSPEKYGKYL